MDKWVSYHSSYHHPRPPGVAATDYVSTSSSLRYLACKDGYHTFLLKQNTTLSHLKQHFASCIEALKFGFKRFNSKGKRFTEAP